MFMLISLTLLTLAHAERLGQLDCYYIKDGQLKFASSMGCVEKRRSVGGDSVSYQIDQRRPADGYDEPPGVQSATMSLRLNKKDGRIVSFSKFEGEDPQKAPVVQTVIFKNQTGGEHGEDLRRQVTLRENGRETNLVTYDRDFCAKLHGSGNFAQLGDVVKACAASLVSIKKAAWDFNREMAVDQAKLGVASGKTYRAANVDGILDLYELVRRCKMYPSSELPRPPTNPGEPAPPRQLLPAEQGEGVAF